MLAPHPLATSQVQTAWAGFGYIPRKGFPTLQKPADQLEHTRNSVPWTHPAVTLFARKLGFSLLAPSSLLQMALASLPRPDLPQSPQALAARPRYQHNQR